MGDTEKGAAGPTRRPGPVHLPKVTYYWKDPKNLKQDMFSKGLEHYFFF